MVLFKMHSSGINLILLVLVAFYQIINTSLVEIQPIGSGFRITTHSDSEILEVDENATFSKRIVVFRHSDFAVIPKSLVLVFPNAKEFQFVDCQIRKIQKSNFLGGDNVKKLTITRSLIRKLPSEVFAELKKLVKLDLRSNRIDDIHEEAFKGLKNLKTLILFDNQIETLTPEILKPLVQLKSIDLSRNLILSIPGDLFAANQWLEVINLDNCGILELDEDAFIHLNHLKRIHLTGNAFLTVRLPSLYELHASFSTIKECYINGTVQRIWLDSNYLDTLVVNDISQLKHANISNNSITEFNFLKSAVNVKSLDLSLNPMNFTRLTPDLFSKMVNLQYLYLAKVSLPDLDPQMFANLSKLKFLDLSDNLLSILDFTVFIPLRNLETLKLSGNDLLKLNEDALRLTGFRGQILY